MTARGRNVAIAVLTTLLVALPAGAGGAGAPSGLPPAKDAGVVRSAAEVGAPLVLPPAKAEGVAPTAAGVRRALGPVLRHPSLGPHAGAVVYDASRHRLLYGDAAARFVPASTLKVLTTTAALAAMGAGHRFTTKVVGTGSSIVLVGGGDPLLASRRPKDRPAYPRPATLPDLAAATAKALRAKGVRSVTLGYDATLFTGPAVNHRWLPTYLTEGIASPTSALWVDQGRLVPGRSKRAPDPASAAAKEFAEQLTLAGVKVGGTPRPTRAGAGAPRLAQVRSPSLGTIVEHVNLVSDNDAAEVLLRHIGLATQNSGSYAGGLDGLRVTLAALGLGATLDKARLEDGSGLSRTNAVPLALIAKALLLAVDKPELRHVVTGLPVARFTGTLGRRFAGPGTTAAGGTLRAKTGTLTSVHSLAGVVRSRTGTLLVFAVATDAAPPDKALAARAALDRAAAALATCGCA